MATATKKKPVKKKAPAKKRAPSKRTKRANATKGLMVVRGKLRLEYATVYAEYQAAESEVKAANAQLMLLRTDPAFSTIFKAINAVEVAQRNQLKRRDRIAEIARKVADKLGVTYDEFGKLSVNTDTGAVSPTPEPATQ